MLRDPWAGRRGEWEGVRGVGTMAAVCFQPPRRAPGPMAAPACELQSRAPHCVPAPAHPHLPAGTGWDRMPSKRLYSLPCSRAPDAHPHILPVPDHLVHDCLQTVGGESRGATGPGVWGGGCPGEVPALCPCVPLWGPRHLLWGWLVALSLGKGLARKPGGNRTFLLKIPSHMRGSIGSHRLCRTPSESSRRQRDESQTRPSRLGSAPAMTPLTSPCGPRDPGTRSRGTPVGKRRAVWWWLRQQGIHSPRLHDNVPLSERRFFCFNIRTVLSQQSKAETWPGL